MPICTEKKSTLLGPTHLFECELLHLGDGMGVLRYIIDAHYDVNGIRLQPGDVTYALYWENRPYTLYVWRLGDNRSVYYFNIADGISLTPSEFIWRDLSVDILIDLDRGVHILDEDEVPGNIPAGLKIFIESAKRTVLADYRAIIRETNTILHTLLSSAAFEA